MTLRGDGETIVVRVDVPAHLARSFAGRATAFSVARFADGSKSSVRLHMLDEVAGEPRHGMLELVGAPAGKPPESLAKGDRVELIAGGTVILTCWVAEN